jgi:hypothetical protein
MLLRRLTSAEAEDPNKRQLVEFWNLVHALEHTSDVRLGIWRARPPKQARGPVVSSTPFAVLGWQGRSRPAWTTLPLDAIRRDPSLLGTGKPDDVVLARRSLPEVVVTALEQQYSYRPELDGQQAGWWFIDGKKVPKHAPTSRSTIALLPEPNGTRVRGLRDGVDCLVLVDVDDWWAVLSETALLVYEVGTALDEHRPVQFAQWDRGHRIIWDVQLAPSIHFSTVHRRFGKEAAKRAIKDAKSIVVRCTRHS